MDQNYFNTDEAVRKSGSHLTLAERGMIQALHKKGMSLRGIAKSVGCAHTTIYYELKRGTPPRKSNREPRPGYTAKRGQEALRGKPQTLKRPCKIDRDDCEPFIQWMCERIRKDRWSIDGCVGAARLMKSFPGQNHPLPRHSTICGLTNCRSRSSICLMPWDGSVAQKVEPQE